MNNEELARILKKAPAPKPSADYLERFPSQVRMMLNRAPVRSTPRSYTPLIRWAAALAAVCLIATFWAGFRKGKETAPTPVNQIAGDEKLLREVQAEFPNQVRAIVMDENGAHLLLSEKADVPGEPALYLKVCDSKMCETIITFSGQQIPLHGDLCDILEDGSHKILVVGQRTYWTASKQSSPDGQHFEARTLNL